MHLFTRLDSLRSRYCVVRWLFPRLLGCIYLIAFTSWAVQYDGLVGENGILPAQTLLESVHAYEAREHQSLFWEMPTLFYWHYSDAFAHHCLVLGSLLSGLVIIGIAQGPLLLLLWFGYLSFATTGGVFMGFQWDALLLESGLLTGFLAPWRLLAFRATAEPPRGSIFLLHWLLFRLMFLSGYVKLGGGDAPWQDMTALLYHYETQPLPNGLSWFIHQAPRSFHIASCWLMYVIELGLPFLIFAGRWGRLAAALGFTGLMAGIFATGNYNFFNLLTAALALTLLDDRWWPRKLHTWLRLSPESPPASRPFRRRDLPSLLAVTPVLLLTGLAADSFLVGRIPGYQPRLPQSWHTHLEAPLAGTRSFNAYGLFQDMTEERLEIEIEVSDDGALFIPLEFKHKPGDPRRAPDFIAPHQPRLDWQMWFAALYPGHVPERDANPASPLHWFHRFLTALLEHKAPVWALVEPPFFPVEKIVSVRTKLYRYRFTTSEERQNTGAWWHRELLGNYGPRLSRNKD